MGRDAGGYQSRAKCFPGDPVARWSAGRCSVREGRRRGPQALRRVFKRRLVWLACVALLVAACAPLASTHVTPASTPTPTTIPTLADFPTVNPAYIYDQLDYLATHFLHREAGYDANLPPNVNGHDEFAAYWAQEISRDLQGFGPVVRRDTFQTSGWTGRPPVVPAFNVEVSVAGETQSAQEVVIGCHYDGEAVSTQSAYDDASGCAIELGVAQALASYWRSHHVYPARTLRFVLFDAEEQGLYGSFAYVNDTVNGDIGNIVAMINEEQSGIAYPLRYLGLASNPLLPLYIDLSPLRSNAAYPDQNRLSRSQQDAITSFRALMQGAIQPVFQQFRALGFGMLDYWSASHQPTAQAAFTAGQQNNMHPEDDVLAASDEMPFTLAGLPCATLVGNATYYPEYGGAHPPAWSYPFDQPQDTIQLMNVYASGGTAKSQALALALALPGMLTTWALSQPEMLGVAAADGKPLAAISDIGPLQAGHSLTLDASASYDPAGAGLTYTWSFGDGVTASGVSVTHTYATPGSYQLTLTVRSPGGMRVVTRTLDVATQPRVYQNPYAAYPQNGSPPANPAIVLPTPTGG
jgi:Peptidase family M28/PKD domain